MSKFTNKYNQTQYRFYEKNKDPYTDKWERVIGCLNKMKNIRIKNLIALK